MFNEIDKYYDSLKDQSYLVLRLEDLLSFRILSEKIAREESNRNGFDKSFSVQNIWELENSKIVDELSYYRPYLNSLCHIDGEESLEVAFTKNDFKYMPDFVKECIFNIIFNK